MLLVVFSLTSFTPMGGMDRNWLCKARVAIKGTGLFFSRRLFWELEKELEKIAFPFFFQLDVILPATLSTSAATLVCMMIVCFIFMYNLFTVIVATVSIVSICIGMFLPVFFLLLSK